MSHSILQKIIGWFMWNKFKRMCQNEKKSDIYLLEMLKLQNDMHLSISVCNILYGVLCTIYIIRMSIVGAGFVLLCLWIKIIFLSLFVFCFLIKLTWQLFLEFSCMLYLMRQEIYTYKVHNNSLMLHKYSYTYLHYLVYIV